MYAAQMRKFEKMGMSREQSEALTTHITELLCHNKEKLAAEYVSKFSLEKVRLWVAPNLSPERRRFDLDSKIIL